MNAYLRSLRKAVCEPTTRAPAPDLQTRLQAWFNGLPEFTRRRPFSMAEFEQAVGRPGRLISPALLALGWRRGRKWTSRYHYHRLWLPPES